MNNQGQFHERRYLKHQKWRLTFVKFNKTRLAFRTPKVAFLSLILKCQKAIKRPIFWHFICQNWHLKHLVL